ncbi:MAG: CDP-alcohol phosphatidyltransferase family protein [Christensenellales bacterium]
MQRKPLIKYVPNLLTVFRLLLVPVFYMAYWRPGWVLPNRFFACTVLQRRW